MPISAAPIRNTVTILGTQIEPGSPLRPAIEMIGRQAEQMALLLDDLLDVSQLTRGAMVLRREWVALQDVVDAAVETSGPVIAAARHELVLSLPSEKLELYADPTRLAQAFANVLNNAAKYTDPGGRIWLTAAPTGDGCVEVRVKDTGIGRDALDRIFDMFAQGPDSERPSRGGLGIGLSLVRGLVALHGGTIQAASPGLGLGAEFVIRLPILEAPQRERLRRRYNRDPSVKIGPQFVRLDRRALDDAWGEKLIGVLEVLGG